MQARQPWRLSPHGRWNHRPRGTPSDGLRTAPEPSPAAARTRGVPSGGMGRPRNEASLPPSDASRTLPGPTPWVVARLGPPPHGLYAGAVGSTPAGPPGPLHQTRKVVKYVEDVLGRPPAWNRWERGATPSV
ncbi:uncharacterized protein STAUR_8224 [Stigmatella aurantiaca DW4/3-1]|uniref:Uncharacterized protein n=1 Tax=Stigmatella aurantiaca (strain DW4/3-1) TaxID=378806 RepID=E3FUU6_STIAD|nr:uncharacterized protein STAUR_8224 [Stigmatella aurantiaca DW4/3-1]